MMPNKEKAFHLLHIIQQSGLSLAMIRDCYSAGQVNALPDAVLAGDTLTDLQEAKAHILAIEDVWCLLTMKGVNIDCTVSDIENLLMILGT